MSNNVTYVQIEGQHTVMTNKNPSKQTRKKHSLLAGIRAASPHTTAAVHFQLELSCAEQSCES